MKMFVLKSLLLSILVVGFAIFIREVVDASLLIKFDELGSFVTVYGTVYGVLLGFIVVEVWSQHNTTQDLVDKEAIELENLHNLTKFAKENNLMSEVRDKVASYVKTVLDKHPTSKKGLLSQKGSPTQLNELSHAINELILDSNRDIVVFENLMTQFRSFRESRSRRNRESSYRLPDPLRYFLQMSSVIVILAFTLSSFASVISMIFSVGVLTFLLTFIHLIIIDLDDPLSGYWKVEFDSFEILSNKLKR